MRAVTYSEFGGPEVLQVGELGEPPVGPDSVLIRTCAAGVNPVDFKVRRGKLNELIPARFPVVPGWDVAGVIERVGPAVEAWRPGDEVLAYNRQDQIQWGTCAQFVTAPQRVVARKPATLTWAEAGALPLAGLTALQCLVDALQIRTGETVLVHGASGGVGSLAVQIVRALGAHAIGTASPPNHDFLQALGARAVAYGDGLQQRVRQLEPAGVDAVLDLAGGDALACSPGLLCSASPARIASVIDAATVKRLGGHYVFVAPSPVQLEQLAAWAADGTISVPLAEHFALDDVAAAHRRLEHGHVRGKLVIDF